MTRRTLSILASAIAVVLPAAALAAWTGAPANPPNSNANGPIWLQTSGISNQVGNIGLNGDMYVSHGKAIRVDGAGATHLNIGNYNGSANGFTTFILGHLTMTPGVGTTTAPILTMTGQSRINAYQICLTSDTCRTSWPTGGGGGGGLATSSADLRYVQKTGDMMSGTLRIEGNVGGNYTPLWINYGGGNTAMAVNATGTNGDGITVVAAEHGVLSNTTAGYGLSGNSQSSHGVLGQTSTNAAAGGIFYNNSTGVNSVAVYGIADACVNGASNCGGRGVSGSAANGIGVYGYAANQRNAGVYGFGFYGVQGSGMTGIRGDGTAAYGVEGYGPTTGVLGAPNSAGGDGFMGYSYQAPGAGAQAAALHGVGGVRRAIYAESFGNSSTTTVPTVQAVNSGANGQAIRADASGASAYGVFSNVTGASAIGGRFVSASGDGIQANGGGSSGIWSVGGSYGGYFDSAAGTGVYGVGGAYGVQGVADNVNGIGGYFRSGNNNGKGVSVLSTGQTSEGLFVNLQGLSSTGVRISSTGGSSTGLKVWASGTDNDGVQATGSLRGGIFSVDASAGSGAKGLMGVHHNGGTGLEGRSITTGSVGAGVRGYGYHGGIFSGEFTGVVGQVTFSGGIGVEGTATAANSTGGSFNGSQYDVSMTNGRLRSAANPMRFYVGSTEVIRFDNAGAATKSAGTTWGTAFSDARLKDVKGLFTGGLDEIMKLKPVYFTWKKGNSQGLETEQKHLGFIAQDVQKIFPEMVATRDSGYLGIDSYDPIMWAMLNSIKELKTENDSLKSQLDSLTERIEKLEAAN
jgi:hypothetical protein